MQLGIRLHDIKKAPLEERLAIAKEQGFLCGHLALSKVITEYPVDDGALTPGYAMYLKKIFAKNDLDIAVLGCYLNLANPDEGQLAKITHRYLAHIRFASLLGVGVVGTETGAVNEAYKFEEKNHSDEALDIFLARDLKKTHQHGYFYTECETGDFLCRKNGRYFCNRAGVETYRMQSEESAESA